MPKIYVRAYVEKVNEDDGTLSVAIASDATKDRQGEVISLDAWDFSNFKRNPVLMWAHDYSLPPIGKVEQIEKVDGKVLFKPKFAVGIDEFATKIFRMFKEGYLNAFSVGFQPQEAKEGDTWNKVELLEISAVPVPANPNALVLARSLGLDTYFKAYSKAVHGDVCDVNSPDYDPDLCDMEKELKAEPEIIGERVHVRVRNPERFIEDSFRTIKLDEEKDIEAVIGKLKTDPNGTTKVQKYTFGKDQWSIEDAVSWVRDHIEGQDDAEVGGKEVEAPVEKPAEVPETPAETPAESEEKSGRVLSAKNIATIQNALSAMKDASGALKDLLEQASHEGKGSLSPERSVSDKSVGVFKIIHAHMKKADEHNEKANRLLKIITGESKN